MTGFPFHGSLPKQFHNTHPGNLSNKCYRTSISNRCITQQKNVYCSPKMAHHRPYWARKYPKFPLEKQRETSWHQVNHFTKLLGEGSGSDWSKLIHASSAWNVRSFLGASILKLKWQPIKTLSDGKNGLENGSWWCILVCEPISGISPMGCPFHVFFLWKKIGPTFYGQDLKTPLENGCTVKSENHPTEKWIYIFSFLMSKLAHG